jgi:photosystem II stability/assembly factor-like uncharacterized protein
MGTRGGILASTDGGDHWGRLRPSESADLHYTALAIDPAAPATLYAGTDRDGIVKSTDGGRGFETRHTGVFGVDVTTLGTVAELQEWLARGPAAAARELAAKRTRDEDSEIRVPGAVSTAIGDLYAGTDGGIFQITKGRDELAAPASRPAR